MPLSDLYRNSRLPLTKTRSSPQMPTTDSTRDYDPDLFSRDKAKQKAAVKKFLLEHIRSDWDFRWPPPRSPAAPAAAAAARPDPPATVATPPAADRAVLGSPALSSHVTGDLESSSGPPEATSPSTDAVVTPPDDVDMSSHPEIQHSPAPSGGAPPPSDANGHPPGVPSQEKPGAVEEPTAQVTTDVDDENDSASSAYSTVSEDPDHFRPLLEWASDISDATSESPSLTSPHQTVSPFRFDSPDTVGAVIQSSLQERRDRRRRALRAEMEWNDGLACFEARRAAWTGSKTVRLRPKPMSPTQPMSPLSPRRFFFRQSVSIPSPVSLAASPPASSSLATAHAAPAATVASENSETPKDAPTTADLTAKTSKKGGLPTQHVPWATVETLIPLPPPLLPPENPMRASVTPAVYLSLYDKVIIHNLTPSCPVNLADMLRSCVAGWKRDGEWPPPSRAIETTSIVRRKRREGQNSAGRRLSFGFLGSGNKGAGPEKDEEGGPGRVLRRGLQRMLGIGHPNGTEAP